MTLLVLSAWACQKKREADFGDDKDTQGKTRQLNTLSRRDPNPHKEAPQMVEGADIDNVPPAHGQAGRNLGHAGPFVCERRCVIT